MILKHLILSRKVKNVLKHLKTAKHCSDNYIKLMGYNIKVTLTGWGEWMMMQMSSPIFKQGLESDFYVLAF